MISFTFSDKGISCQESKKNALVKAKEPNNANEVRSFLGLATYCERFIPNLASKAHPLRELTKKNVRWHWDEKERVAFESLRKNVIQHSNSYFNNMLRC